MPFERVSAQFLCFSMPVPQDMYRNAMFSIQIDMTRGRLGRLGYGV
jgi:hypothetical protein